MIIDASHELPKSLSVAKALNTLTVLIALTLSLGVFSPTASASTLLDNLQPGHWAEVPNSRLDAVAPVPLPPGNTTAGGSPFGVVSAESGAAFDTKRNRFMVWGGGHGDYSGNEIYAFDVDTLTWDRIEDPTPNGQIPGFEGPHLETYSDGKPASRHSYDSLVYLPDQDVLWTQGGSLWANGFSTWATWQYDLTLGTWEQKADASSGFANTYGVNAQYDPVTENIIWRHSLGGDGPLRIQEYDPATDVWTVKNNTAPTTGSSSTSSALDPGRRTVVYVGTANYGTSRVWTYNIDTETYTNVTALTTGDKEIQDARAPGVAYDPVADTIVAWSGANLLSLASDVYTLDLDTLEWTKIAADSANTVSPTLPTNTGTFGRWQYIPSEDVFMLYNNVDENVFFYRLPSAGLSGDYNGNGIVDAADYTVWLDNLGASAGTLPNDSDGGVIGQAQYDTWKANFGTTSGASTNVSIPEPTSLLLLLLSLVCLLSRRR